MELKKREGLGKKIAIGVSLINLANMVGPVGVPVADISVPGGHVCADNDLHGTSVNLPGEAGGYVKTLLCPRAAYAAEEYIEKVPETSGGSQTVTAEDGVTQTIGTLCSGGKQVVNSGGTGIVSTIVHDARVVVANGKQVVNSGGTGTVIDMYSGEQLISAGGTGTVITQRGGDQRVYSGGTATVITADNGAQAIESGGTGTVITNNGGQQYISGGTGTVITMNGGRESHGEQFVYGGTGTVITNNGGYQYVNGGAGTIKTMNDGQQIVKPGGTGTVEIMNGGMQRPMGGTGNVTVMNGGMEFVESFGSANITTMNGGVLENHGGTCNVTTVNGGSLILSGGNTNITNIAHFVSGTMGCYSGAVTNIGDVYPGVGLYLIGYITSNFTQNSGTQTIHSGATVKSFELTGNAASGGTQLVLNGGMAEGTVVREYGSLIVEAGGRTSGTVLAGGTETIMSGGISDVTNMSGGEMNVSAGGTANIGYYAGGTWSVEEGAITNVSEVAPGAVLDGGTQNSGTQKVDSGATTDNFVFVNGAAQEVLAGGTSKNTTVSAESTIIENSGAEIENLTINGGTWQINSGVTKTDKEIKTYTLDVRSGGTAENITVSESGAIVENPGAVITIRSINNGGTWRIGSGVTKENQAVSGYTLEIMSGAVADGGTVAADGQITVNSGGVAENTKLNGGKQTVNSGGKAMQTVVNGGRQTINNGGMASETTLDSGSITVNSGGKAIKTAVNNGELSVASGGEATETVMQGGTISVDDNASVQIDEATAGCLRLLYTGDAIARFGNSSVSNHSYSVDRLFATGDKAVLGHGNGSGYSINNTLNVGTMEGYADFVINTDLANNKSDKINIMATTGAAGKNGVIINYDPSVETMAGSDIPSSSPTGTIFATTDSAATFEGKEGRIDVGGNTYEYTPELIGTPNGSRIDWSITKLNFGPLGPSPLLKNNVGNRAYMLGRWRDGNADILKRLNDVRRGEESGIWVAITRGNQKAQSGYYNVKGTYTNLNLGFDRKVNNGWIVGGAISHSMGSEGYENGSGESKLTSLSAYAMWQAKNNQFAEFTVRVGQLKSDLFTTGNSGTAHADGITSWGQSLSAAYGMRFKQADGWVFEPKAEFTWAHLNGAGYMADFRTSAYADSANSAMASLGLHIGKFVGSNGYVYLDTKLVHDFAGGVAVDMYNRGRASLADNIRGTWLDMMLGYSCKAGACDLFVEGGLRAGGSGVSRDWQYRLGFNWAF